MPTVGGVLMRVCEANIRGEYAQDPWRWPAAPNCQLLYEELTKRGIASEEINWGQGGSGEGRINSTAEYVAAAGAATVSGVVDAALAAGEQLMALERAIPIQATERFRISGLGNIERATIAPLTRLNEFRGQDLAILEQAFRTMPPAVAEALLKRIAEVDRDGRLGILRPRTVF